MNIFTDISSWFQKFLPINQSKDVFPSPFANKCILIIEDDAASQEATQKVLERRKFKTLCADSGEEGIQMAGEQKPDLVILDSRLPGIQGPEVCKRIKQDAKTKDIPIIFLTIVGSTENIVSSFDYGADNYLMKPIKPQQLIEHIEKIFEGLKS